MLCYCRISHKRYPFNVMLVSNIIQTLSLQCYVSVEYPTNVIPSMLCYCRISYKRNTSNVMLLSNIVQTLYLQCYVIFEYPINVIP